MKTCRTPRERNPWSLRDLRESSYKLQKLSELLHEVMIQIYSSVPGLPSWMLVQCLEAEAFWFTQHKNRKKILEDLHIDEELASQLEYVHIVPKEKENSAGFSYHVEDEEKEVCITITDTDEGKNIQDIYPECSV